MGRLNARLRRIEGQAARAQQMHVVTGHSDNEHWTKIDELLRSGKARRRSAIPESSSDQQRGERDSQTDD